MCNAACIEFGKDLLSTADIRGRKVIEVGSYDVNGSLRAIIEPLSPELYVGVDVTAGPGVDELCDITDLSPRFGRQSFDLVVSTELMEHVQDWRKAVGNLKQILKPGGILMLTTRSKGFGYHAYPYDFWRYELEDMQVLFSDMDIEAIRKDPTAPGVFLKARMPEAFAENNLQDYELYSIALGRRCRYISDSQKRFIRLKWFLPQLLKALLPAPLKTLISKILSR